MGIISSINPGDYTSIVNAGSVEGWEVRTDIAAPETSSPIVTATYPGSDNDKWFVSQTRWDSLYRQPDNNSRASEYELQLTMVITTIGEVVEFSQAIRFLTVSFGETSNSFGNFTSAGGGVGFASGRLRPAEMTEPDSTGLDLRIAAKDDAGLLFDGIVGTPATIPSIALNTAHRYTVRLRDNSDRFTSDGLVEAWFDDILVYSASGLNFGAQRIVERNVDLKIGGFQGGNALYQDGVVLDKWSSATGSVPGALEDVANLVGFSFMTSPSPGVIS